MSLSILRRLKHTLDLNLHFLIYISFQFLTAVHAICQEMETRWPAELAGVRLQHFTVSYSPCLDCMRAEWRQPQAVRCHCNKEALEEVTFYTSPSLTYSKIGNT